MRKAAKIQAFRRVVPMIYAYATPGVSYHEGWTKIGYTDRQTVQERVRQQTCTAGIRADILWQDNAMYKDGSGEYFTDRDFHAFLESNGVEREARLELFHLDGPTAQRYFQAFAMREKVEAPRCTYVLRREQREAVEMTKTYFQSGGKEFLWNAKPRFGKTLTAYDLIRQMGLQRVLIVTNRPSVVFSWLGDFRQFVEWRGEYAFVSDRGSLDGMISRDKYVASRWKDEHPKGMIAFASLQNLKGFIYFGDGMFNKLKWIHDTDFDLLIVDEAQEGIGTDIAYRVFRHIGRKYTLYSEAT